MTDYLQERSKETQNAIDTAKMWKQGKIIEVDEIELCSALLREVERLEKIIIS